MEDDKHKIAKTIVIPQDIIEEIFQHLPVKALTTFKILSKKYREMIESAHFSHKRLVCKGLRTPNMKLLVVSQQLSTMRDEQDSNSTTLCLDIFSRDDYNNGKNCPSSSSYYTFPDDPIDKSQNKTIQVLGSCDGLILIRIYEDFRYIYLINPSTKKHMTLFPEFLRFATTATDKRTWRESQSVLDYEGELVKIMPCLAGFGKDIVTKSYKVILLYPRRQILLYSIHHQNCHYFKVEVISLDNGLQREADTPCLYDVQFCEEHTSVYANGSLFWLTLAWKGISRLLAIDLHTEKFRWISLPKCHTSYATSIEMGNLNDRLCLSNVLENSNLQVWSLQEDHPLNEKWKKIYYIDIKTSQLNEKFWMFGLPAAYFPRIGKNRDHVSFARNKTISYSPTMISPSSLML
ncbi:PREDICTED: putative F-box protein At1g71320 [Camelina sativa]|uniref:F-box protein At1g71320 n=1 Tax=Camelina sativa TaxID=90675 RepID=A0ABM0TKX9_CAMSA|nr:PREDICTED: putative F-box protein At1g71320 [Camelina sativa]